MTKADSNSKKRLSKILNLLQVSNEDVLEYLKLSMRLQEKKEFVDYMIDTDLLAAVQHVGHIIPDFIAQISKVFSK
jgi:hypothetical protein